MIASEPILPAIIGPVLMPMPMSSAGRPSAAHFWFSRFSSRIISSAASTACSRVIGIVERRAEERHHHVADELVERAFVRKHDLDHAREVLVEDRDDLFRLPFLGHGRETRGCRKRAPSSAAAGRPDARDPGFATSCSYTSFETYWPNSRFIFRFSRPSKKYWYPTPPNNASEDASVGCVMLIQLPPANCRVAMKANAATMAANATAAHQAGSSVAMRPMTRANEIIRRDANAARLGMHDAVRQEIVGN